MGQDNEISYVSPTGLASECANNLNNTDNNNTIINNNIDDNNHTKLTPPGDQVSSSSSINSTFSSSSSLPLASSSSSSSSSPSSLHLPSNDSTLYSSISSASSSSSSLSVPSSLSATNQLGGNDKILLFHPSIISPSNARKLENAKNVTVLYNPISGNKRGGKVMMQAVSKFKSCGLEVITVQLKYKGHATDFCKNRSDFEGIDVLCVVGGDGTFHEVINGIMNHPLAAVAPRKGLPVLSVIPAGTGNSLARELQGISSVRVSTDEVLLGTCVAVDILKVTILSVQKIPPVNTVPAHSHTCSEANNDNTQENKREEGKEEKEGERHEGCDEAFKNEKKHMEKMVGGKRFINKEVIYAFNSIHWGLASRVLEKAEKLRWMGHGIRYTAASLIETLQGTSTNARVVLEDGNGVVTEYENDAFCLIIANNIGTAGKGMTMAPYAKINDGLIDILLIRTHKPWHLMKIFERLYSGTHVDLPYVEYKQVRKFSIFPFKKSGSELSVQSLPEFAEELVDIDGELKGCTPFECEVLPQALEIII